MAVYLYHKGEHTLPVFITHDMDFVSLDSYRDLFRSEKFMILTQDDIEKWLSIFCLKLLHIRNHSDLYLWEDILKQIQFEKSDIQSALLLDIRNKIVQLREELLSVHSLKDFLKTLVPRMEIVREGWLFLKNPNLAIPKDHKELLSLFDIAWSCNSQYFYYLLDGRISHSEVSSLLQDVQDYLLIFYNKVSHFIF